MPANNVLEDPKLVLVRHLREIEGVEPSRGKHRGNIIRSSEDINVSWSLLGT